MSANNALNELTVDKLMHDVAEHEVQASEKQSVIIQSALINCHAAKKYRKLQVHEKYVTIPLTILPTNLQLLKKNGYSVWFVKNKTPPNNSFYNSCDVITWGGADINIIAKTIFNNDCYVETL